MGQGAQAPLFYWRGACISLVPRCGPVPSRRAGTLPGRRRKKPGQAAQGGQLQGHPRTRDLEKQQLRPRQQEVVPVAHRRAVSHRSLRKLCPETRGRRRHKARDPGWRLPLRGLRSFLEAPGVTLPSRPTPSVPRRPTPSHTSQGHTKPQPTASKQLLGSEASVCRPTNSSPGARWGLVGAGLGVGGDWWAGPVRGGARWAGWAGLGAAGHLSVPPLQPPGSAQQSEALPVQLPA